MTRHLFYRIVSTKDRFRASHLARRAGYTVVAIFPFGQATAFVFESPAPLSEEPFDLAERPEGYSPKELEHLIGVYTAWLQPRRDGQQWPAPEDLRVALLRRVGKRDPLPELPGVASLLVVMEPMLGSLRNRVLAALNGPHEQEEAPDRPA